MHSSLAMFLTLLVFQNHKQHIIAGTKKSHVSTIELDSCVVFQIESFEVITSLQVGNVLHLWI